MIDCLRQRGSEPKGMEPSFAIVQKLSCGICKKKISSPKGKALIVYLAGNSNKNMVSVYPNPTV